MKESYKKSKPSIMKWRKKNVDKYNEYMRIYTLIRKWKKICANFEQIENYEKAKAENFHSWVIHHKLGIDMSRKQLIDLDLYYDRPIDELIFMKKSDHSRLHIIEKNLKKI